MNFEQLPYIEQQKWIIHATDKCSEIINPYTMEPVNPVVYARFLWEQHTKKILKDQKV